MVERHHITMGAGIVAALLGLVLIGLTVYYVFIRKTKGDKEQFTLLPGKLTRPLHKKTKDQPTLVSLLKTGTTEMPAYFEPKVAALPNQWNPSENNGNAQALVSKYCSDMYYNVPDLFHNRYGSMGECEADHRMLPLASQPKNLEFVCKTVGKDIPDCENNPMWALTGMEYSKC